MTSPESREPETAEPETAEPESAGPESAESPSDGPADPEPEQVIFSEPARSFISTLVLGLLLAAGWLADLALGGAGTHALAWVAAIVIVLGADSLAVRAARSVRSITVTPSEVRVGDSSLQRADIMGLEREVEGRARVLGRSIGEGMPRGARGLTVHLSDGTSVTVPVRRPDGLIDALGVGTELPEIRVAGAAEYVHLADIEGRADQLFSLSGMHGLPDPATADDLAAAVLVLVAGRPAVGFAHVEVVDGVAHLEQLSVLPRAMRRGIGSALVEAACAWATTRGYPAITLITFEDVPWNAPFYAGLGFAPITELTPGLVELRDWERDLGLDTLGTRVVMRRELPGGASGRRA